MNKAYVSEVKKDSVTFLDTDIIVIGSIDKAIESEKDVSARRATACTLKRPSRPTLQSFRVQVDRKVYLMAVVDLESKHVPGWAVDPSANRNLSRQPSGWEQVRKQISSFSEELRKKITNHDLDSAYTSYRWPEAILLDDEMRVSHSENGAKDDPWIESLWGRR